MSGRAHAVMYRSMSLRTVFPKNAGFAQTHWPRRWLVHHAPLARFERLAEAPDLSSPKALLDRMTREGLPLFVERHGEPFHEVEVSSRDPDLFANGATYTCFGVERFVPAVAELLHEIRSELDLPSLAPTCHGYISGAGARIRAHFDRQENLAIQLSGKKRWQLADNRTVAFPHENHALGTPPTRALRRLARAWPTEMPKPARTVRMRPGSALFLPRGMWHTTETLSTSLSLTLIFPVPNWAQTLTSRLLERLLLEESFREPAARSPSGLAARREEFVSAARAVCEEGEDRYVLARGVRPHVRRGRLEAKGVTIALLPRYVPFVRWVVSRDGSFAVTDAPLAAGATIEAAGILSFLEAHGILQRASPAPL